MIPNIRFYPVAYENQVDKKTSMPVYSLVLTTLLSFLLGLISIGSPVAFNDVISLSLCSLCASYFLACALLLWRRCTNAIKQRTPAEVRHRNSGLVDASRDLMWGPWRIPGFPGIAINAFACIYLLIIFLFGLWPTAVPVKGATMNYSSLVMGSVMTFSGIYYVLAAHKTYKGPVVENSATWLSFDSIHIAPYNIYPPLQRVSDKQRRALTALWIDDA